VFVNFKGIPISKVTEGHQPFVPMGMIHHEWVLKISDFSFPPSPRFFRFG